eukprot:6626436-Pyramimonas_sp.AAC.1
MPGNDRPHTSREQRQGRASNGRGKQRTCGQSSVNRGHSGLAQLGRFFVARRAVCPRQRWRP